MTPTPAPPPAPSTSHSPASEFPASEGAFGDARRWLAGGVSASARINPALQRPLMVERGEGARLFDLDGNAYLDFHMGFGSTMLGHGHPAVRAAIEGALDAGVVAGSETVHQARLAERLAGLVPSAERVRYANSGSEATLAAIRLARAVTGRRLVLKFAGHFHGLHDGVLYAAHPPAEGMAPGALLTPVPESAGVPAELAGLLLVADWNDAAAVEVAFRDHGSDLAAVICEPVNYNAGCLPPRPGFLPFLREITARHGTLLIFDEVLSGFRTGTGCVQGLYGVVPDLTTLAKAVANGVPLAVLAGRAAVMDALAPTGPAAHSGTYTGHLFGVRAALATLDVLTRPGFYDGPAGIGAVAARLYGGLREVFARRGVRCRVQGLGARFGLLFGLDPEAEVWHYRDAAGHDSRALLRFARACFRRGLYFHTYDVALGHHGFSAAHTVADVDGALDRIESACADL